MRESQGNFILPEYLPHDTVLTQFHHMRVDELNSLLQHWTQRQASGEIPFRFKTIEKIDRQRKRASTVDDTPIGAGRADQSESQQQDAHGDQERVGGGEGNGDSESSAKEGPDRQVQDTNSVRFLRFHAHGICLPILV